MVFNLSPQAAYKVRKALGLNKDEVVQPWHVMEAYNLKPEDEYLETYYRAAVSVQRQFENDADYLKWLKDKNAKEGEAAKALREQNAASGQATISNQQLTTIILAGETSGEKKVKKVKGTTKPVVPKGDSGEVPADEQVKKKLPSAEEMVAIAAERMRKQIDGGEAKPKGPEEIVPESSVLSKLDLALSEVAMTFEGLQRTVYGLSETVNGTHGVVEIGFEELHQTRAVLDGADGEVETSERPIEGGI